jgi:CBS domain-containing protein
MAAIGVMLEHRVGAVVVLDDGRPVGIFTERDVMAKVVVKQLDPATTTVSAVMTSPVIPIDQDADVADALQIMIDKHIRHLPVIDHDGKVLGMLSMRHIMREQIEILKQEVGGLANYIAADGGGG